MIWESNGIDATNLGNYGKSSQIDPLVLRKDAPDMRHSWPGRGEIRGETRDGAGGIPA